MNSSHRAAARAKHDRLINPVALAIGLVSVVNAAERAERLQPYQQAVQHLQFGSFGVSDWRHLADAFNLGEVLAQPPFNLGNNHLETMRQAHAVLGELAEQHQRIRSWTARATQLATIKDALFIHEVQLRNAGIGELLRAEQTVANRIRDALASRDRFTIVEPMQ